MNTITAATIYQHNYSITAESKYII